MTEQKIRSSKGLTTQEAKQMQLHYGKNELIVEKKESFMHKILHVLSEPMFMLLIAAAVIYFILGEPKDGAIMLVFVVAIISIEVIQEWKTDKTLKALKDLSAPHITVVRDDKEQVIESSDLVPGDIMLISEGIKVPADGYVIKESTLCIDESSLTGESEGVWKIAETQEESVLESYWRRDYCYAGTLVTQGTGIIYVDKIGSSTEYGIIGKSIAIAPDLPTPLQVQTAKLVKLCAGIAATLFVVVGVVTFLNIPEHEPMARIVESILAGITLAMAMIPEEFPVILTVFLSMGAWRLARKQSLVRKLSSVETLGAVSVLCVDKTGTITMNQMTVRDVWCVKGSPKELALIMGMGCKPDAYDPMEKAMISYCEELGITRDDLFGGSLIKEYPFSNELKMMGHVWQKNQDITAVAKGSPEQLFSLCDLTQEERKIAETQVMQMSALGLRVIAVAKVVLANDKTIPGTLSENRMNLMGLVGLADPPRESIREDIETCTSAGIRVVMITGDYGITASSIAKQIHMPNSDHILTGDELNTLSDEALQERVKEISVFSRVIPEHKMRIVKAFKANGEIVAMTGDGVNDAPALKYADIGIAMGKRGSEVSREAADLILLDDNFSTIVHTIEDGRRIYDNIRKAVGYVFTIHIPIAFAALFAPLMGINPASLLLLPLHVVLLELVIDPTCSIVLERQPAEKNIMNRMPRNPAEKLITVKTLLKSILQGLVLFAGSFGGYLWILNQSPNHPELARSMGLTILLLANILLVQVNSSDTELALQSFMKLIKDRVMWMVTIGTLAGLFIMLYTPASIFLKLAPLSLNQFSMAILIAMISVLWYEVVKIIKLTSKKQSVH